MSLINPQRTTIDSRRGFTLIELLFAMSFVSVLLIIILTSTLQITKIYNKGITLKQVNQSGAAIGSELQTSMKSADPLSTAALDSVSHGRLCLGTYSYVWNLQGATNNQYTDSTDKIGMVKVEDTTGALCVGTPGVQKSRASELILGAQGTSGVQLQLRDLKVTQAAQSGQDYIYIVNYTISTDSQELIEATSDGGSACKGGASDEYCALNSFGITVFMRKGGSGKI